MTQEKILDKLGKIKAMAESAKANAEFGSFTIETVIRAGCGGTYWEEVARTLDDYHEQVKP